MAVPPPNFGPPKQNPIYNGSAKHEYQTKLFKDVQNEEVGQETVELNTKTW